MLKAYDFSKYKGAASMSRINSFNKQENEIAESLVKSILAEDVSYGTQCTVCGSDNTQNFFEKWGVIYYRCNDCNSIYVKASEESIEKYRGNETLIKLRTSDAYQEEETENRDLYWEELLDWVKFRTFRYVRKKNNLNIIDYGNRYRELVSRIKESDFCNKYELRDSILDDTKCDKIDKADIILYLNKIQQSLNPLKDLREAYESLDENGLLFLSTRIGTGFDILTLKSEAKIFPYEHVLLPSVDGLNNLLEKVGFTMLEYSTPGRKDVEYVHDHGEAINPDNLFIKYMMEHGDEIIFAEFQRFLQKSGFSSHAQIVAKKEKRS